MLSKSATLLMGLIYDKPLNAYEITKILNDMNIQWWFYIADSTVYTTLKNLEKRELLLGTVEKVGNMPERTIYSLTAKGKMELKETIRTSIVQFDYDTNIFTISAFLMHILEKEEAIPLLKERLQILQAYLEGIRKQDNTTWISKVPAIHVANVRRMTDIVNAEITGTQRLLSVYKEKNHAE